MPGERNRAIPVLNRTAASDLRGRISRKEPDERSQSHSLGERPSGEGRATFRGGMSDLPGRNERPSGEE